MLSDNCVERPPALSDRLLVLPRFPDLTRFHSNGASQRLVGQHSVLCNDKTAIRGTLCKSFQFYPKICIELFCKEY